MSAMLAAPASAARPVGGTLNFARLTMHDADMLVLLRPAGRRARLQPIANRL